jgi:hypothetical protein
MLKVSENTGNLDEIIRASCEALYFYIPLGCCASKVRHDNPSVN